MAMAMALSGGFLGLITFLHKLSIFLIFGFLETGKKRKEPPAPDVWSLQWLRCGHWVLLLNGQVFSTGLQYGQRTCMLDAAQGFILRKYGIKIPMKVLQQGLAELVVTHSGLLAREERLSELEELLDPLVNRVETIGILTPELITERIMSGDYDLNYSMLCLLYNAYWKSQGYVITVVTDAGSV